MSEPDAIPALTYAAPVHAAPRVVLYRIAQVCWIVPAAVGLALLALYALTHKMDFAVFGYLTILGGGALLFVGIICLAVFTYLLRSCAPDVRHHWRRRAIRLSVLTLANIPLAIGCAAVGIWLMSRFPVVVINDSSSPVHNVIVSTPGDGSHTFGTVPPKSRASHTFKASGEGSLTFTAIRNGTQVSGEGGYVSAGLGGKGVVTFTDSGESVSVDQ